MKKYETISLTNENKKNILRVCNCLKQIPRYNKIFNNIVLGGCNNNSKDCITNSYNTPMYKCLINDLTNYLIDLFDSQIKKIPDSLDFFEKLEAAKEKLKNKYKNINTKYSYEFCIINLSNYNKISNIKNPINITLKKK